jgi:hypothetical protein
MMMAVGPDADFAPEVVQSLRQIAGSYTTTGPAPQRAESTVDDEVTAGTYLNRTGHFQLSVPDGWKIAPPELRNTTGAGGIGTIVDLKSGGLIQFFRREAELPLNQMFDATEALFKQLYARANFEKVGQAQVKVGGRSAFELTFKCTQDNSRLGFVLWLFPDQSKYMMLMAGGDEAYFNQNQDALRKVLSSYTSLPTTTP